MLKLINNFFPDWMTIRPGEWSEYPLELVSAGNKKFYANLYREPAKNEEYANTLTLQIQQGDDVIFCSKIDVPYVEFLECYGAEMVTLDVYDTNDKEFKGDVPDDYLVVDVKRRGDSFDITVAPPEKPAKREFFVDTPLGKLRVYAKRDIDDPNDFPGVYVNLITPAAPQGDMLACVEYGEEYIHTCV